MATYKKRGAKKSLSKKIGSDEINESKTAEVFDSLDITANKTEDWVVKYQNIILFLKVLFETNFSIKLLTISFETNSPEFIIEVISEPNLVLLLISFLNKSPVDN